MLLYELYTNASHSHMRQTMSNPEISNVKKSIVLCLNFSANLADKQIS